MGLDAIGIVSTDLERSLHFYRLLSVGFARSEDSEHFEAPPTGGVRLMLDSVALVQKFEPEFKKVRGTGLSLCFKQESRKKVDEVYAAVTVQAGFQGQKAPWDAFWGQRYACVLDPDGNQIDLFAD